MENNNEVRFEELKKKNNYCGVVDMIVDYYKCCSSEVDMEEVVLAMIQNKSWDYVVRIPLVDRVY